MVPHWAEFAFTRGVNKLLPASTPPLNAISSHWVFRGAKSLPLVDSKMLVIIQHGIHLLGQQGLVEIPQAMFSSLLWSFMFPFCWETADVHLMSLHVLSEVPVQVDFGFVALGKQPQVEHMMIMNCCLQLMQALKYEVSQEQQFQHSPCQPEEGTVFRKHMHGISHNCHAQCLLG